MPSASSKSSQVAQQNAATPDLLQDPMKNAVSVLEKKLRNLEKRKLKLLETKKKADKGEELNEDQKKALENLYLVNFGLETVKDVHKSLASLESEYSKLSKKEQKRQKQEQKDQVDSKSHQVVGKVVEVQAILGELSEEVRPDFIQGTNGACKLTEDDLANLDAIYELINPADTEENSAKLTDRVNSASEHLTCLVEGRNKPVNGEVTYKDINDILQKIQASGYFDKDNSNGEAETVTETTPQIDVPAPVEEERPEEESPPDSPDVESPEEEFPSTEFQQTPPENHGTAPAVPVNGVDLPPEVQETPEDERIDFMGESEISTAGSGATEAQPSLNPTSPEFIPIPRTQPQAQQEDNAWGDNSNQDKSGWNEGSGDNWQSVSENQSNQQGGGNYRGRGRGGRGYGGRGRGRGGGDGNYRSNNYRGRQDGNYRGGGRGGRGGDRGNRGGFRGGQRGDRRGGRGGSERGGYSRPQQQQ